MINFDSLTLNLFYQENLSYFEGAKIQKIQQPSKFELIFQLRSNSETKKFYINFHPGFYHLCFISNETEQLRNFTIPKIAPMFCMLLRKYLQNARILQIKVPKYERIFELYFEYFDELNEKQPLCLAVELMGKYSNIILYNSDTNVIIGCAHNVSSEKSRERELRGTLPYIYPKKQPKKNLLETNLNDFLMICKTPANIENLASYIASKFHYLTGSFVQDCIDSINPLSLTTLYEKLVCILQQSKNNPCIKNDYSKYYVIKFDDTFNCNNINDMIDKYFSYHQHKFIVEQYKSKINKHINVQLAKLYTLKENQELLIKKFDTALDYKNKADILSANLYKLKRGNTSVTLSDFTGNPINIILDENKSPTENINNYYNRYKKSKTAYTHALTMLQETNSQILYFEETKYFCENTVTIQDLKTLSDELSGADIPNSQENISSIETFEVDGYKIYAGKNKKQNDFILSKLSDGEDLWFHPLNAAGAHILVKTNKSDNIPDNVLLKAAEITKQFSSQKNNSKTSVIYTKRKYVKKAAQKQAFVTYKNETEIVV